MIKFWSKEVKAVEYYRTFKSPYIYVSLAPLLWSTNFILAKILITYIPAEAMVAVRVLVGAVVLAILLIRYGQEHSLPNRIDCMLLLIMGATGVFGFSILTYSALRYTTPVNATLISALYPVLATILCFPLTRESLGPDRLTGLILSLAGILLITARGSWEVLITMHFNPGDILAFLATACWAVYSVVGKIAMKNLSVLAVTTYSTLWGLVLIGPFELFQWTRGIRIAFSWQAVVILVYIGIVASVVATFLWNRGVREIGPDRTGYFYNLLPIYSAFLAILFLGEKIYWYHIVGGLMVICGVILGTRKTSPNISGKTVDPMDQRC